MNQSYVENLVYENVAYVGRTSAIFALSSSEPYTRLPVLYVINHNFINFSYDKEEVRAFCLNCLTSFSFQS